VVFRASVVSSESIQSSVVTYMSHCICHIYPSRVRSVLQCFCARHKPHVITQCFCAWSEECVSMFLQLAMFLCYDMSRCMSHMYPSRVRTRKPFSLSSITYFTTGHIQICSESICVIYDQEKASYLCAPYRKASDL